MTWPRTTSKAWRGYAAYLLPAAPIVIYWAGWLLNRNYWFTTDPAAWYFLDSLAVFAGKSYVYVDHPGTPVHVIGSILLGLTYPLFGNRDAFIRYYIAEPETFFFLTNLFLLAANVITLLIFYKTIRGSLRQDNMLAGIAVSLMYFGIHPGAFSSVTYWSHNSFNFIFGTLWLLWLYNELQSGKDLRATRIFLLGITVGALVTTQLYLLPWLAGGTITIFVYALRQGKSAPQAITHSLIMFGSGLLGILILLAPVYRELPRLLEWLRRLIGSQGLYGAGEESLYSLGLIPVSLGYWWQHVPLVMLALIIVLICFGLIVWFLRSRLPAVLSAADVALAVGLFSQTFLLILVLSKMFYRIRYVLALSALLPVLFLLALKLLEQVNWKHPGLTRAIYAGLIGSTLFFMSREIAVQQRNRIVEQEAAAAHAQVVARLARIKGVPEEQITIVYAFGTPFKCAGLLMANNWIRAFDTEIGDRCPNQYAIYDFAYEVEMNIPHSIVPIEELNWDLVVWPGNGSDLPEYLESVGAEVVPKSWHIRRAKWFYLHPEVVQE